MSTTSNFSTINRKQERFNTILGTILYMKQPIEQHLQQ